MTKPDDALGPDDEDRPASAEERDPSCGTPTRGRNQAVQGGSSLGDGPPPKAGPDKASDAASQGNVSTDRPENYGGGYGGQPRPKTP